jgi:hypothetical protein
MHFVRMADGKAVDPSLRLDRPSAFRIDLVDGIEHQKILHIAKDFKSWFVERLFLCGDGEDQFNRGAVFF